MGGLGKRGVLGTWHRISAKHLRSYCDEMCFRFNNRKNPYLFRDKILKLIAPPNLETRSSLISRLSFGVKTDDYLNGILRTTR